MRIILIAIILISLGCSKQCNYFGCRVSGSDYEGIIVINSPQFKFNSEGNWVPDKVLIAEIEKSLPEYVVSEIRSWSPKYQPLPPLSEYKRQYWGEIENKKKVINIVLYHKSLVSSGEWLHDMGIAGGGNHVLHVRYDTETRKFNHFHANSDA
jgi:hypothetical protein